MSRTRNIDLTRGLALLLGAALAACSSKSTVREPAELKPIEQPALKPVQVWSARAGQGSDGQRSGLRLNLQPDALYAADVRGEVFAYARETGKLMWRVRTQSRVISGPEVSGDAILLGTRDAEVIALRRADGAELWRSTVSSEVLAPPRVAGEVVVTRSVDGRIYGLSASAGQRVWSFDRVVPNLVLRGNSAPLLIGDRVFVGMDNGRVVGLRVGDGQPLWEQAVSVPSGRTELERLTDIDADLLDGPDCLIAASFGGEVACLDAESGQVLWRRSIRSYTGMVASADKLFVTDDTGTVWGLDLRTGAAAWKQDALLYRRLSAPGLVGGHVVVGDLEGYLHWIDPSDGRIVARKRIGDDPILAAPVVDGERAYVTDAYGRIAAIEAPAARSN